ncbi:MAG: hypothetical protein QXP53_02695 [Candidatus Pacearchaeota archaeon]
MLKNKKGIHHVEYAIAVSIFLIALIFILSFSYVPLQKEKFSTDSLEKIFRKQTEISVTKIILNVTGTETCYNISLNSNLPNDENKVIIKNNNANPGFTIHDGRLLIENGISNIYEIYSFEGVAGHDTVNGPCTSPTYSYSLPYEEKLIFNNSFANLNYDSIKSSIGKDFSIIIKNESSEIFNLTKMKPLNVEVQAKEFHARMINPNAEVQEIKVILQVW